MFGPEFIYQLRSRGFVRDLNNGFYDGRYRIFVTPQRWEIIGFSGFVIEEGTFNTGTYTFFSTVDHVRFP